MAFSEKWTKFFLGMADYVATASKDPSTQVGAVLVDEHRRVVGIGYNGFPDSIPDNPEWLADRETKYRLTIHAETNACLNCSVPTRGLHLFVNHPPCSDCTKFVIQAGIVSVTAWKPTEDLMSRWAASLEASQAMFSMAGVPLILVTR
jgi:dCMP deaminase